MRVVLEWDSLPALRLMQAMLNSPHPLGDPDAVMWRARNVARAIGYGDPRTFVSDCENHRLPVPVRIVRIGSSGVAMVPAGEARALIQHLTTGVPAA